MTTIADRNIDKLVEPFKSKVEKFLNDERVKDTILITEAFRTQERQDYLYSLWRTLPWKKVTWTKDSNHSKWLAVDIAFKWKDLYPKDIKEWKVIAKVAKQYWIDWGYDLWGRDMPHLQDNFKQSMEENKYIEILDGLIKDGYEPIFNSLEWIWHLNEWETKALIEIAIARTINKLLDNKKA